MTSLKDDMVRTGLNWTALEHDICTVGDAHNGVQVLLPDHKALIRSDTGEVLNVVGSEYNTLQPWEMFEWVEPMVDRLGMAFDHVHEMNRGRSMVVQYRLPKDDMIAGEKSSRNVYIGNGYGTAAISTGSGWTRAICANTWAMLREEAKGNDTGRKFRHTKNSKNRLAEAGQAILEYNAQFDRFATLANRMAETQYDSELLKTVQELVIPSKDAESKAAKTRQNNRVDKFMSSVFDETNKTIEGSVWGLFNGVTHYYNHGKERRGARQEENTTVDLLFGDAFKTTNRVWNVLVETIDGNSIEVPVTEYVERTGDESKLLDSILDS